MPRYPGSVQHVLEHLIKLKLWCMKVFATAHKDPTRQA